MKKDKKIKSKDLDIDTTVLNHHPAFVDRNTGENIGTATPMLNNAILGTDTSNAEGDTMLKGNTGLGGKALADVSYEPNAFIGNNIGIGPNILIIGTAMGSGVVSDTVHSLNTFSIHKLLDAKVTPTTVELVYSHQNLIWTNNYSPKPEIYKEIYSRIDGSMNRVNGTYVPANEESYKFD